jgi:hypothetical protein
MHLTPLFEITFSDSPQVDREAGIIRGVRILGRMSRNGREYSDAALRQAAGMYEGIGVNLNHPSRPNGDGARLVEDGFGWLQGVSLRSDGVYGDLHYFRAHPSADVIVEAAARNPRRFGLSHHADGSVVNHRGRLVVESIESVRSVDLVQNPATTNGLFESEAAEMNRTVLEVLESAGGTLAELADDESFRECVANAAPVAETGDAESDVPAAILSIVSQLLEDEQRSPAERLVRVALWTKACSGEASSISETDLPNVGLLERIERIERENYCRGLLESAGRACDPSRIERLAGLETDDERQQLIECWADERAPRSAVPRPSTSRPLFESGQETVRFPETTRAFVAAIR